MTITRYFQKTFPKDITKLQFRPVPQVIKDIFHDQTLVLFGGAEWENVQADLQHIACEDRTHFVLSLFAVVLTDQCMHRYFKPAYSRWRADTQYPKFGWNRFGLFNENPLKLLWAAEQAGLLDVQQALDTMPLFVGFYRDLVSQHLQRQVPAVAPEPFLHALLHDDILLFQQGLVVAAFQAQARSQWTNRPTISRTGWAHLSVA